jgi:Ca2+-binding RTX toxin-like protein
MCRTGLYPWAVPPRRLIRPLAVIVALVVFWLAQPLAAANNQLAPGLEDGPAEPPSFDLPSPESGGGLDGAAAPIWQLPFEAGQWWQAGSPHSTNALDFGPLGGTNFAVVAMAAGTAIEITCSNGASYIGVDHGGGWQTHYYHLTNVNWPLVGQSVDAGTRLGDAAQTLPCGGFSSFNHVHVTFWKNGLKQPVNGTTIGGYTVFDGASNYWGHWEDAAANTVITNQGTAQCCLLSTTTSGPTCNGLVVTVDLNTPGATTTAGDDVVLGTPGADTINGLQGDDTICGRGGPDTIRGGAGRDTIFGGAGADNLRGGGNADTIVGGPAPDRIAGQGGADLILGGGGHDILDGGGAADTIDGQSGDDSLNGAGGSDSLDGGQGDDVVRGQDGPDVLIGRDGDDEMFGGGGADTHLGGGGLDKCSGNTGPDRAELATCEQTPGVEVTF